MIIYNDCKVSVIVPIYNMEKHLNRCVDSILSQSYNKLEVILVDDGSTDDSWAICESYKNFDERVITIHQENHGVSSARNRGMDRTTGDYLMFVDSDDELLENAIEILINDSNKFDADIVAGAVMDEGKDGIMHCSNNDGLIHVYNRMESLERVLEGKCFFHAVYAKLYKKAFIDGIRFVEGRSINEDGFFLFQCSIKKPVFVTHNIPVYRYCYYQTSACRGNFSDKYFDMLFFANEKKVYIKEHYPELLEYAINMEVRTHLGFLQVLCRTNDRVYLKKAKNSIAIIRRNYKRFNPENRFERRMVLIVVLGLYPIYHWLFRIYFER